MTTHKINYYGKDYLVIILDITTDIDNLFRHLSLKNLTIGSVELKLIASDRFKESPLILIINKFLKKYKIIKNETPFDRKQINNVVKSLKNEFN